MSSSDIPALRYSEHLFQEKVLRSVTANTRADGEELLAVAARIGLRPHTTPYPLEAADRALADLAAAHETWLHVDGAYGLPAAGLPELAARPPRRSSLALSSKSSAVNSGLRGS